MRIGDVPDSRPPHAVARLASRSPLARSARQARLRLRLARGRSRDRQPGRDRRGHHAVRDGRRRGAADEQASPRSRAARDCRLTGRRRACRWCSRRKSSTAKPALRASSPHACGDALTSPSPRPLSQERGSGAGGDVSTRGAGAHGDVERAGWTRSSDGRAARNCAWSWWRIGIERAMQRRQAGARWTGQAGLRGRGGRVFHQHVVIVQRAERVLHRLEIADRGRPSTPRAVRPRAPSRSAGASARCAPGADAPSRTTRPPRRAPCSNSRRASRDDRPARAATSPAPHAARALAIVTFPRCRRRRCPFADLAAALPAPAAGASSGSIAFSIASIWPSQSSTFFSLISAVSRSRAFSRSRRSIAATCSRPRAVGSFSPARAASRFTILFVALSLAAAVPVSVDCPFADAAASAGGGATIPSVTSSSRTGPSARVRRRMRRRIFFAPFAAFAPFERRRRRPGAFRGGDGRRRAPDGRRDCRRSAPSAGASRARCGAC